jgi:glucose/arabinose dehydrogenase
MNRLLTSLTLGACGALAAAPAVAQNYTATVIANGLTRPVYVGAAPGDTDRLFILEQRSGNQGRIRVFNTDTNTLEPIPYATFTVSTSSEQGLLGLAFHPDFASNGRMFVNYTNTFGDTVIAELGNSDPTSNVWDPSTFRQILTIDQPFSNHNAGWLDFGPDGFLYISSGDGGSGNDPGNRSQDITNQLLGKMLRVDVDTDDFPSDNSRNYGIPASNPFVGVTGDDEIWAYGLRNVWRADFDPATGDLFMADVGQNAREEVNLQPADSVGGENYGWRCLEGTRVTGLSGCNPSDPSLVPPIVEYTHSFGCSITGGIIYRGCEIPSLQGAYLYADVCTNRIWKAEQDGQGGWNDTLITGDFTAVGGALNSIVHFGRGNNGELYILSLNGRMFEITSDEPTSDWNGDGGVNIFDVVTFITDWNNQDPSTNINGDGNINILDVVAFITLWNQPCG